MNTIEAWENPPEAASGVLRRKVRSRPYDWVIDALRKRPGTWARVASGNTARLIMLAFKQSVGYHHRALPYHVEWRWVGEASSGDNLVLWARLRIPEGVVA